MQCSEMNVFQALIKVKVLDGFSSVSGKDLTIIEVSETGYFAKWPNLTLSNLRRNL